MSALLLISLSCQPEYNPARRSPDQDLFNAICLHDTARVRRLIDAGADVNEVDTHGHATPLGAAADEGYVEIMSMLIDRGADVNKKCPLCFAAYSNNIEGARLLLKHGADPGLCRADGLPVPILGAAQEGHLEMLKLVSSNGALIVRLDDRARAELLNMAAQGTGSDGSPSLDVVKYLLSLGVDANLADSSGQTPLHTSAFFGKDDFVRLLLRSGGKATIIDRYGKTALDYARERGHAGIVRMLENPAAVLRAPATSSRAASPAEVQ